MVWRAMLLVIVGVAMVPFDAFAIDCNGHAGRNLPARKVTKINAAPPHELSLSDRSAVGCYGFDHGPIFLPHRCNFSYPCEYYGTCKRARRDSQPDLLS